MSAINSVCVYCGSASKVDDAHKEAARELGRSLAERGLELVYGGGRLGLMGIVADAALEARGRVLGVIPEHLKAYELEHTGLTELIVVPDMHTRKRTMVDRSDAFVVLPGGLGTLDEAFEVMSWKQLGLHDKPIVVRDVNGFWNPLVGLVDHMIGDGFVRPEHRSLFAVAADTDAVFDALNSAPPPKVSVQSKWL